MTFEEYQKLSLDQRLDYGISQALARMATMDAVIVTDEQGNHWEVHPKDILPAANDDTAFPDKAAGFAEDRTPFETDND